MGGQTTITLPDGWMKYLLAFVALLMGGNAGSGLLMDAGVIQRTHPEVVEATDPATAAKWEVRGMAIDRLPDDLGENTAAIRALAAAQQSFATSYQAETEDRRKMRREVEQVMRMAEEINRRLDDRRGG